jgi:hypothetical protein
MATRASRRFWFEFGFPGLTVVLACALIYHFTVGHRGRAASVEESSFTAAPEMRWPPPPDSAGLAALPLPRTTPFEVRTLGEESRIIAEYVGTLTLDGSGLHLRTRQPSRLAIHPYWEEPLPLDSVVFALAEPAPSGWRIAKQAPAFIPTGGTMQMPEELTVSGVTAADLPNRWPVVVHWYRAPDVFGQVGNISMALQGGRDVLSALLDEGASER